MSFGFSVGDFIGAIGLIVKVGKAIGDTGGASLEYQHVQLELRALKVTLEHLQALEPEEDNLNHINAIRGVALACQIPLHEFLNKIQRFEKSLGPFSATKRVSLSGPGRKSQWSLFLTEEVTKLRAIIAAKVLSINLLLGMHISGSISRLDRKGTQRHTDLLTNILQQRSKINQVKDDVSAIRNTLENQSDVVRDVKTVVGVASDGIERIAATTESIHTTVVSMRDIGHQLLNLVGSLPVQVRNLLENIIRTNLQMYSLLQVIQVGINRMPSRQIQDCILFEDVLGRTRPLPYEFFRHYEMFDSFLRTEFKDKPGEERVLQRQYLIMDSKSEDTVVTEDQWSRVVFPGSQLTMSILIEQLRSKKAAGNCPKTGCTGTGQLTGRRTASFICDQCGIMYSPQALIPSAPTNVAQTIGPQEKPLNTGTYDSVQLNYDDLLVDEDDEWKLDTQQAKRDMQDLRVFRRVHIIASKDPIQELNRSLVFFDMQIGTDYVGRIIFELFDDITPKAAANFRALCTGEKGISSSGVRFHYKGSTFHRVIQDFMIQGGHYIWHNGTSGLSIYGERYDDENFEIKHSRPYFLSMANGRPDNNNGQFFITTVPAPHLDDMFMVFGHVVAGRSVVRTIERQPCSSRNEPIARCVIVGKYLFIYYHLNPQEIIF